MSGTNATGYNQKRLSDRGMKVTNATGYNQKRLSDRGMKVIFSVQAENTKNNIYSGTFIYFLNAQQSY